MLQAAAQILLREFRAVNSFRWSVLLYIVDNASARRTLSPEPSIWIIVRGRSSNQGETTDLKCPKQWVSRAGTAGSGPLTSKIPAGIGSSRHLPTFPPWGFHGSQQNTRQVGKKDRKYVRPQRQQQWSSSGETREVS